MRIKTFSPEMAGVPSEKNLEEKMVKSDVITSADIREYTDYIIGHLKALKNQSEQEKESFVVDALSDNNILRMVKDEVKSGDLDENEAKNAIGRVRQALIEELKGKMDDKIYLVIENIKNATQNNWERRNIINLAADVGSGPKIIYKDQESYTENIVVQMRHDEAFDLFSKLAPHPNIVSIKEYDPDNQRGIFEKLNLKSLDLYLYWGEEGESERFLDGILVLRDCMSGALYLANNGLVLQDIKLANMGLAETADGNKKGILFDLEGLMKAGTKLNVRITSPGYMPPELLFSTGEYFELSPKEMVFQFGVCLRQIIDIYAEDTEVSADESRKNLDIIKKLQDLAKKMVEANPKHRINLSEANDELADIINKL